MTIYKHIEYLIKYGVDKELITIDDEIYVRNKLLDLFNLPYQKVEVDKPIPKNIDEILKPLLDYAVVEKIIAIDTIAKRDIFEAKIMDILLDKPSIIKNKFNIQKDPISKTDYLYNLAVSTNYIKTNRVKKNIHFSNKTKYGNLEITINLSKPEKDPRDIKAQVNRATKYPKCLLCKENVGYNGLLTDVGRTNHRIVPITLNNEIFYFQYSPYVYYDEHCILLSENHLPMNINKNTFSRLLDFVEQFPHYFLGSNAGLPIVGGSILSHEHYQGGRYHFPIENAQILESKTIKNITFQRLYWPVSVIRVLSNEKDELINVAAYIMKKWRRYDNIELGIIHKTTENHNAITPIARKIKDEYILDIALRNNRTTDKYPMGLFHAHPLHHHIKKENIGLIEVMGLAVLPGRLKEELDYLEKALVKHIELPYKMLHHHKWLTELKSKYDGISASEFLKKETINKFSQILENAGVFKQDQKGQEAFSLFFNDIINEYQSL